MGMEIEDGASAAPVTVVTEVAAPVRESEAPGSWGPVPAQERIQVIDVVRGVALFGIVAANMRGFAGPLYAYFRPEVLWTTRLDRVVQALVDVFIQGKFISLFAFLFGVGFALQFSRAETKHARFVTVYRRRLEGLILIGLLHQLLFWWGDVLVTYGLGGFLLVLFRKRKNKTVLIWTLALMLVPFVAGGGYLAFRHFRPLSAEKTEANRKEAEQEKQKSLARMRETISVYQTGSYADIYRWRVEELVRANRPQPFAVVMTLPLFLLGLLVYRLEILQNPGAHRARLKKALVWGALAGIPMNVAGTYILYLAGNQMDAGFPDGRQLSGYFLLTFGRPILSMAYASALVLLFLSDDWRARLSPFAAIGRTALSNYLFQTIFCTTIFFGYGGGLYGKAHLAALLALGVAVYALELPLSRWWLAHYRFGPAEWAWRSITYGRLQAMRA